MTSQGLIPSNGDLEVRAINSRNLALQNDAVTNLIA